MKIVYNKIIPFSGYKAINLFGILFVRSGCTMDDEDINHESIHTAQMEDFVFGCSWLRLIGAIFFYLWYVIEFLIRLIQYQDWHSAYRNISFEREAFANEDNLEYLDSRKGYAFVDYIIEEDEE